MTFGEKVIEFNKSISLPSVLEEYNAFNIYEGDNDIFDKTAIMEIFYRKYFSDTANRVMILGSGIGRYGVGDSGVPYTNTEQLVNNCGVKIKGLNPAEISSDPASEFFYDMIDQYGGLKRFYHNFFVSSVCPIGLKRRQRTSNWIHSTYYDSPEGIKGYPLAEHLETFIVTSLRTQIAFGIDTSICFAIGIDNARRLRVINNKWNLFGTIIRLEQPRFVEYRSYKRETEIERYLELLSI